MSAYDSCFCTKCHRILATARDAEFGLCSSCQEPVTPCNHPPERLYTGFYTCYDAESKPYERQWIGCCKCGKIIGDRVSPLEKRKNRTIHPDIKRILESYGV